jgi:hypothetical protein
MAYYYGVNAGDSEFSAAVGSSTTSKDVEIVVNQTNVPTKQQLMNAIEVLENWITKNNYPPV